ncbi:MAG: alpha/beta hydrolase [Myxococcales bacterium]|nr:alpha/beta hydrolase [Myxococcales bacterium]
MPDRTELSKARYVESADGTRIAYYVTHAPRAAPTIVLANGLGGPRYAWMPLIDQLCDRFRFITWDYRGLYGSDRPAGGPAAYAIERHVDDLEAIVAAESISRATLMGWSMGVQVCLEATQRMPALPSSLVLLNGTFGRPLDTAIPQGFSRALPHALDLAQRYAVPLGRLLRKASTQPELVGVLKRFGVMAETVDEQEFATVVSVFGSIDVEAYVMNLRALGEHDASRLLPSIPVPALVIAGDRDKLTHRGLSQQMVRRIPRAEILVVRGGTHYTAVEFPELLALRIERFLSDAGVP